MRTTEERSAPVICPRCGESVPATELHCGAQPLLDDRYVLHAVVGHGAIGTTYEATRVSDDRRVAVKEMLVRRMDSMKAATLFEREAAALRQLDHPAIPKYVDDFQWGEGKNIGLYLVQEFIDGETLAEQAETRGYSAAKILEIAEELLDVLDYIHSCSPPRIHRDLKPANIMRRRSDGRLVLIDFGSVRHAVRTVSDGSTISGTVGYMAPEQLFGVASPQTDIFGLGMTLLALHTGEDAFDLVRPSDGRRAWLDALNLDEPIREFVRKMTRPVADDRPSGRRELERLLEQTRGDLSALDRASIASPTPATAHGAVLAEPDPTTYARPPAATTLRRVVILTFTAVVISGMWATATTAMDLIAGGFGLGYFAVIVELLAITNEPIPEPLADEPTAT